MRGFEGSATELLLRHPIPGARHVAMRKHRTDDKKKLPEGRSSGSRHAADGHGVREPAANGCPGHRATWRHGESAGIAGFVGWIGCHRSRRAGFGRFRSAST
jgi:hypothetical protein